MSTENRPTSPPAPVPGPPPPDAPNEVTVVSHSQMLYWWPVWACGFLMAFITYIDGSLMATVPPGTVARIKEIEMDGKGPSTREVLIAPEGKKLPRTLSEEKEPRDPVVHMARNKSMGVIFFTVLLLVVFFTNVPLRGVWSVMIIVMVVMISLILHLLGWWERIIENVSLLDVRINMGGYLFVSTILFVIWFITVVFFDRRIYIIFTPGQFRVCTEIGGGEKVFDTMGMKMEKQQSDLFRHYILGLGAGDLIVKTSGATNEHFDLHNVLWINWKVQQIEDMLHKKKVVGGR